MKTKGIAKSCEDCQYYPEKEILLDQGYWTSSYESKCVKCFRYLVPKWVDNWKGRSQNEEIY